MGLERSLALGSIRFSLGHQTSESDIARAIAVFPGVVEKVRQLAAVLGRA
jgi:cysteine sulfinate desulfinase/cysteine desulfurase-like protein